VEKLLAEAFAADPRIAQARALVLETLREHRERLAGTRPADPERAEEYARALERFEALRGGRLYFPYLASGFGRGCLVELADGSVKYDMVSGIGVHHLGHGDPGLVEAAFGAALQDVVMLGNLQQSADPSRFAALLLRTANTGGAGLRHCFFTTSGAMANENALKIAFHARRPATRVLAFEGCFMGRTLTLAQITDKPGFRVGLPTSLAVDYLPFHDPSDPASGERALAVLWRLLERYPGQYAVLCCELVLGEGGFYPGTREFFEPLLRLARERGVPVLFDEIQTFGRTSEPFAFQHFGLDDLVDLVTVGKLTQVCATLFRAELAPPAGLVSQTFTGSTAAFAAGEAIVSRLLQGDVFGPKGRNTRLHARFEAGLRGIAERRPGLLAGPYGLGAMVAFTPLGGDKADVDAFARALYEKGVLAFTAGARPTRVRFLPPVPAVEEADVDAVLARVEEALVEVAAARTGG
jgi:acetylornithine aminotransferase